MTRTGPYDAILDNECRRSRSVKLELLLLLNCFLLTFSHFAALLAMKHGGCRISTVGDRHALDSVYYRAMKKTLTPLNDVYMRTPQDMKRARDDMRDRHDDDCNTMRASLSKHFVDVEKT